MQGRGVTCFCLRLSLNVFEHLMATMSPSCLMIIVGKMVPISAPWSLVYLGTLKVDVNVESLCSAVRISQSVRTSRPIAPESFF